MGATQWLAATAVPPSLKAMVPCITASDYHDGWTYQGGAFALGFNVSWTMSSLAPDRLMRERKDNPAAGQELGDVLGGIDEMRTWMEMTPLKDYKMFKFGAPYFFDWLEHPSYDSYWQKIDIENHHNKIPVPALNLGRLVRHLPGRHDSQLHRDEGQRRKRGGARRRAPADGSVGAHDSARQPGRRGRLRLPRRLRFERSRRAGVEVFRSLAQRHRARAPNSPRCICS